MFYVDHLHTPSFSIGLVKTESGYFVRSFATSLGTWTLLVALNGIDTYPLFAFSDVTSHLEDSGIGVQNYLNLMNYGHNIKSL